jgi:hypothetical protein
MQRRIILVVLAVCALGVAAPAVGHGAGDTTAPTMTYETHTNLSLWQNTDVTLTLMATDTESGPETIFWAIDGSTPPMAGGALLDPQGMWADATVAALPDHSNDGVHILSFWGEDNALNTSAPSDITVMIDTLAPYTELVGGDTQWLKPSGLLALHASDDLQSGGFTSGVASTWYTLDGGVATQGTSVPVPVVDSVHPMTYWSIDNAGNVEAPRGASVGVDSQPPVTTILGNDAAWHRRPVTLTLTAQDQPGLSGVTKTQYKIDKRPWTTGTKATVKAPTNHSWDGIHTVYYRSVDNAGNVETSKSVKVKIDTTGPTCLALAPAQAVRSDPVVLHYRVNDAYSPTTMVTITIRTAAGKLINTTGLGWKPTGKALGMRFTCRLALGSYQYRVYATDKAGNRQSKVGSNLLTVVPKALTSVGVWKTGKPTFLRHSGEPPFVIWAKAKDQHGYPIAGAKVTFVIPTLTFGVLRHSATTDSSGRAYFKPGADGLWNTGHRYVVTITASYGGVTRTASTSYTPTFW